MKNSRRCVYVFLILAVISLCAHATSQSSSSNEKDKHPIGHLSERQKLIHELDMAILRKILQRKLEERQHEMRSESNEDSQSQEDAQESFNQYLYNKRGGKFAIPRMG
jgi:hypothetical protein